MRKVFLGSTFHDLLPFREAAFLAIQGLDDHRCVRMEDFGARDAAADGQCRTVIGQCDLAVFLVGLCQGSSPQGSPESHTVREYQTAVAAGVPCLIFLTRDGTFYPTYQRESDQLWEKQQAFRRLVCQERVVDQFSAADELAVQVVQAIRNWESSRRAIREPGFFRRHATPAEGPPALFDHSLCEQASLADLDLERVSAFLRIELVGRQEDFRPGAPIPEQLAALGFLTGGRPTHGALLCFGNSPQTWHPGAETRCFVWQGEDRDAGWGDGRDCRGGLLAQLEAGRGFLARNLRFERRIGEGGREERCEVPLAALDEALANALVHREYAGRNEAVRVQLFTDRIEILSPGPPPPPMTVAELGSEESVLRNPLIARIFYLAGHVEKVGSGIPRMQRLLADAGLPPARFALSAAGTFKVVVARPGRFAAPGEGEEKGEELEAALERYRAHLLERYRYLELRGMGVSDRVPLRLALLDMYVPLHVRVETPEGETWDRVRVAGRAPGEQEGAARRLGGLVPALDLLRANDGLILLGDPGSGKTTFLKLLALSLAAGTGTGEELGLGPLLPVLLPLSAYAHALAAGDVPLARFIPRYHQDRGVDLPMEALLEWKLHQGRVLFLLDGLDEVGDPRQRHLVVQRFEDFYSFHRGSGNKFVLTSRIVGYRDVRPESRGLVECTLVDFEDKEVTAFVAQWTTALERAAGGETAAAALAAEREERELLDAVRRNPGVRSLAANPLLLTILALMKRQGVALPERRVELYRIYVETLLKHWGLARSLAGRPLRDLDVGETVKVLAPLALWMHEASPGVGLVREGDLHRELERIFADRGHPDPPQAARHFLEDVRDHAALLLDRGSRQYGFIHLTFQEYLAAVALAQRGQQGVGPIVAVLAAHVAEPSWHEVTLLTIGYLGIVQQRDEAAGAVLEELIRRAPEPPGEAVLRAGLAVADAGEGCVPAAARRRVAGELLGLLRSDRVDAQRRAVAGRILARLGDPRPAVTTVDVPDLCRVPAGPFWMGRGDELDGAFPAEAPRHERDIAYEYEIGRYPVTAAQLRLFLEATGSLLPPVDDPANEPVVMVTWIEAAAFCEWLTARWRAAGLLGEDREVRLPSEAEWEKAARGTDGRTFPWGEAEDPERANCAGAEINRVSAVGCFPAGASPYGCEDMAGNIWEWTRSAYRPYAVGPVARKRRDDAPGVGLPVMRGGSYFFDFDFARCTCRAWRQCDERYQGTGFRVAVVPAGMAEEDDFPPESEQKEPRLRQTRLLFEVS